MSAPSTSRSGDAAQHTVVRSLAFHVVPAALSFAGYQWLCVPAARRLGWPSHAADLLFGAAVLIPVLMTPLLYQGWRRHGRLTLEGVVLWRGVPVTARFVMTVGALLAWALVVVTIATPVDDWLRTHVFDRYPAQPTVDVTGHSAAALVVTRLVSLVLGGVITPYVEELYFRGFILPRVMWLGRWAAPWTAVCFALYHVLSPWAFVSRVAILLPMSYLVARHRNITIGIVVHSVGNTVGEAIVLIDVVGAL